MLGNIAKGFKNARTIGALNKQAVNFADDAFRASAANIGNAQDAAKFYGNRKAYMDDFINQYTKGAQATYDTVGEQVGRGAAGIVDKAAGAGRFVLENPAGQMALFTAPMFIPMGGGGQQMSPQEMEMLQRQEIARQQQLALQQELMQMQGMPYGGYP